MTRNEYLREVMNCVVNDVKLSKIEEIYGEIKNEAARKIVSNADETLFLDNDWRVLSYSEIEEANNDLHVDFTGKKLLPLFDCSENDFVVYRIADDDWAKFNIVDESLFMVSPKLEVLFKYVEGAV